MRSSRAEPILDWRTWLAERSVKLALLCALLSGCGAADITYFRPLGDGKLTSSRPENVPCYYVPDAIDLAYERGVHLRLSAYAWTEKEVASGDTPYIAVSGGLHVPVGVKVKFAGPFRVRAASGREGLAQIRTLERTVWWGRDYNDKKQRLSATDTLTGWTGADAEAAGLIPPGSVVQFPDKLLEFRFGAQIAEFSEPSFVVDTPPLAIDGQIAPGKSVAFTRKTDHVTLGACP